MRMKKIWRHWNKNENNSQNTEKGTWGEYIHTHIHTLKLKSKYSRIDLHLTYVYIRYGSHGYPFAIISVWFSYPVCELCKDQDKP